MSSSRLKKRLFTVVKFGVSAAIIFWLVHRAQQDEHFSELLSGDKNWWLLGAGFLLALASVGLGIFRWQLLVCGLEVSFRFRDALRLGMLGYLLNFVSIGSVGGDLFKALMLAHELKGKKAQAIASVLMDRILGLYGLLLVAACALGVSVLGGKMPREVWPIAQATWGATAAGTAGILVMLLASGPMARLLQRLPWVGAALTQMLLALKMYRHRPGVLGGAIGLSGLIHIIVAVSIWLVANGLPGAAPTLAEHLMLVPLSLLTGLLPLPMSGIGAREAALDFLYTLFAANEAVRPGKGFVVSLAFRCVEIVIAGIGALYYVGARREMSEVIEENSADDTAGALQADSQA